jgi:hypothetical protein
MKPDQRWTWGLALLIALAAAAAARADEEAELPLADCPGPVRKTLKAEARGAEIDVVTKEVDDGVATYWATVPIGGKAYAVGVAADGTLKEVGLDVDEEEIALAKCPAAVQATFRHESKDAKIESVDRDVKYGTTVYATVVVLGGRNYTIVVAQDGTLVEKALVVDEDDVALTNCPPAVQKAIHEHARGGSVGTVTRSSGIIGHVYEAEVRISGKDYVVELAENGVLIAMWLNDGH